MISAGVKALYTDFLAAVVGTAVDRHPTYSPQPQALFSSPATTAVLHAFNLTRLSAAAPPGCHTYTEIRLAVVRLPHATNR